MKISLFSRTLSTTMLATLLLQLPMTQAAEFSKMEALQAIDKQARSKVDASLLDRLLTPGNVEILVEYEVPENKALMKELSVDRNNTGYTLGKMKAAFSQVKQQVHMHDDSREVQFLRDYDALPMQHVRVNGRRSLLKLLADPRIKTIHEQKIYSAQLTESLAFIRQPQVSNSGYFGAGTAVAVLDMGVDYTRSEFGSCSAPGVPNSCRVAVSFDMAPDDGKMDNDIPPKVYHGTNVSSIIAAIAPKTKILAIDVFGPTGAKTSDILSGINWVLNNRSQYNIVAMNLSLGWDTVNSGLCSNSWAAAPFAQARAAGIIPVVSSGNNGFSNGLSDPACAPGAVSVGAVYDGSQIYQQGFGCQQSDQTGPDRVACFSNSGPTLTLWAPGVQITAGGTTMTGTSQAAPHVTGAIAILRSAFPQESADAIINRILGSSKKVTDPRNGITRPRLDLLDALNAGGQTDPGNGGGDAHTVCVNACQVDWENCWEDTHRAAYCRNAYNQSVQTCP